MGCLGGAKFQGYTIGRGLTLSSFVVFPSVFIMVYDDEVSFRGRSVGFKIFGFLGSFEDELD
jgi:hypothetical protein